MAQISTAPAADGHVPAAAPTLTDDVVTLRAYRPDDVPALVEQCTEPEFRRWTSVPTPYTEQDAREYVDERVPSGWADGTRLSWAVDARDPETGRLRYAGNVVLRPDAASGAEIGFGLMAWARGAGVMSRAVRLAVAWSMEALDLQAVHWSAHVGNWPSRRVAWACGFRVEGQVRSLLASRGERHDGWVGSLLRGDEMRPASRWLEPVVRHGERTVLRPWRESDVPRVVEACTDEVSQHWLPGLPRPYAAPQGRWYVTSREDAHAAGQGVFWCVADPVDDRCLASIALMDLVPSHPADRPSGEVGYWSHPDARGTGALTEAVRAVLRHALLPAEDGGLGLDRVTLRAAEGNRASQRVAEKAGFTLVGRQRQGERLRDGSLQDFLVYDVLRAELPTV